MSIKDIKQVVTTYEDGKEVKVVNFYKVPELVVELGDVSFEGAKIKKLQIPSETHELDYDECNVDSPNIPSVKKIMVEGNGAGFPYECFSNLETFELKKGNNKRSKL